MKRRICIFCETWESGGIESFLRQALLHMDRSELEIDLVCAVLRRSIFTAPLEAAGVSFTELSGSLWDLRTNRRRFLRLLRERRYDVLHLNVYEGFSLYYARLAREAGVPVRIVHSHNAALRKSPLKPLKLLLHELGRRLFCREATELWACSASAARFLFPAGERARRGWRFIPNGIDAERFRFRQEERDRVRRELGLEGRFVVGSVGRLCYQKNQELLLEAIAGFRRGDFLLLVVGEGKNRAGLEERAAMLDLSRKVMFYGLSKRVEELYWAMDVFAFPSRFEGLGIAAVEAQAAGLPVLCSDRVPPEACICGNVQRLPLKASLWSETLARLSPPKDRDRGYEEVCRAGFRIRDTARLLLDAYRGSERAHG